MNLHHNDLRSLEGAGGFPALMKLDASSNDLTSVRGLEACTDLREVRSPLDHLQPHCARRIIRCDCFGRDGMALVQVLLSNNDIADSDSVITLIRSCPRLSLLDLRGNKLSKAQVRAVWGVRAPGSITARTVDCVDGWRVDL